jgi:hypothetical protein
MPIIQSPIPYGATLYGWLQLHDMSLDKLAQQSHRYDRAYLAWETVRLVRNPFFTCGTGFEGYFVGICQSPEEMLARLLEIGHAMLASNARMYRYEFAFKSKLMKTLRGERIDRQAIEVWSALLGATLAKLRCHVYYHDSTYRFQNETYWAVNRLPYITYRLRDHRLEQEYRLPHFNNGYIGKSNFSLNALKPSDYDAGLVVSEIGCFGHPLLRAYLRQ